MPTKKLRGGEGRNGPVHSVHQAMGLPRPKAGYGTPNTGIIEKVNKNVMKGASKGAGRKAAIKTSAGYDVKTRLDVPSGKAMGQRSRTNKKMKGGK